MSETQPIEVDLARDEFASSIVRSGAPFGLGRTPTPQIIESADRALTLCRVESSSVIGANQLSRIVRRAGSQWYY